MRKLFVLPVAALLLGGCAMQNPDINSGLVQLEMHKDATRTACYQSLAMNGPDYSKLSDMAIVMIEQQKATAQLVGALTGKAIDPCGSGTNLNDVLIADSTNRNRSLQSLGGGVLNLGKWLAGAWAATEIVDSIGKNAGANVNTGGGDSSISRTNSETNTESVATASGEESTAGTSVPEEPVGIFPADPVVDTGPVVVTEN